MCIWKFICFAMHDIGKWKITTFQWHILIKSAYLGTLMNSLLFAIITSQWQFQSPKMDAVGSVFGVTCCGEISETASALHWPFIYIYISVPFLQVPPNEHVFWNIASMKISQSDIDDGKSTMAKIMSISRYPVSVKPMDFHMGQC